MLGDTLQMLTNTHVNAHENLQNAYEYLAKAYEYRANA